MTIDQVRKLLLSLPGTAESVQWGSNLVFKVAGKMFAVADLEPAEVWLGFKCTPEEFAELVERPGIVPAPYLARAHWVSLESRDALPAAELRRLLLQAYDLVVAKLPKKVRSELTNGPAN